MSARFELPSELTIYSIMEARDALLSWAETHKTGSDEQLEVSAAKVAVVDGAGLQLLVSLGNTLQAWRMVDVNNVLTQACQTMGFARWLEQRSASANGKGT
jgi:hypothetical protein